MIFKHTCVKTSSNKELSDVYLLWQEAFGDSKELIDFMLDGALSDAEIFLMYDDKILCSMFFLCDIQLKCGNPDNTIPALYLYAAATRKNMRGHGYFPKLLSFAEEYARNIGARYILCKPAETGLFSYYKKLGFETCTFFTEKQINPADKGYNFKRCSVCDKLYEAYLAECKVLDACKIKNRKMFLDSVSCAIFDGEAELYIGNDCFALLGKNCNILVVVDNSCNMHDAAASLLFETRKSGTLTEHNTNGTGQPYAMAKAIGDQKHERFICSLLFE